MKKIYLVWIKYEGDQEDRIRGAALNWERAERMALNLELLLRSQGKDPEVGVKSMLHGKIALDSNHHESRWSKENFEVSE